MARDTYNTTMKKILKILSVSLFISALLLAAGIFLLDKAGIIPLGIIAHSFSKYHPLKREKLTPAEAIADTEEFFSTLERIHPDITANIGTDGYSKLKQWTTGEIQTKTDSNGKISVKDLAYILYYSAAAIGDGHTSLGWTYDLDFHSSKNHFPPFVVNYDSGKFLISSAMDKYLQGLEIVAVNDVPFANFIRPILARCSGETIVFKSSRFTRQQAFWWDFTGLFSNMTTFDLETRDPKGGITHNTQATINASDYSRLDQPNWIRTGIGLEIYDKKRIGWLSYPSFILSDAEKAELDKDFRKLRERGVQDLVLDLRGNGGGHSGMGDYILSYLTDKKFNQYSTVKIKLSPDYLKQYPQYKNICAQLGTTVSRKQREKDYPKPSWFFNGKTWLLVDNGTFSSAADFTATFRDYKLDKIIGYETGGLGISFGNIHFSKLTKSGIPYSVSYCQYFPAKPRPGDDKHGIIPDVPLSDKLLRPYEGGVQAFILDMIQKERKAY